jgi:hypothetical protein
MREVPRFLTILSVLIFVFVAVWWLESRFDALVAVMVIGTLVGAAFFSFGALLSHMIAKSTMSNVTQFAQRDAQTDRYRMASFKAMASGQAAMDRAAAQLTVLDARRIDGLAQQRAKLLAGPAPVAEQPTGDVWSWDDDMEAGQTNGASFSVWE